MSVLSVDAIMGHTLVNGKYYYLIKWKRFSDEENTYEPEENILCTKLLLEYKAKAGIPEKTLNNPGFTEISEIIGIKEGTKPPELVYIVRFRGKMVYDEVLSSIIQQKQPNTLLDYLESHLPF